MANASFINENNKLRPLALGVNIDHIATLRQARGTRYPEPVQAALLAEQSGADSITLHLREDRRHIQERDLDILRHTVQTRLNLEMAVTLEMQKIALHYAPADVCLVPERRAERTTEGGLDVVGNQAAIAECVAALTESGIRVSLFIAPDFAQIEAAKAVAAPVVELHTGHFANLEKASAQASELKGIVEATHFAASLGLTVHAGHGLHYHNVKPIAAIPDIVELNIGHAIIAEALFVGLGAAVSRMKTLMQEARAEGQC